MTEEQTPVRVVDEEALLQQQFRRALSSFEGIILSQIDIKNRLGDRLNYSIQAGIIILGVIALSILVLLLTLSSQINRISGVVGNMNANFAAISRRCMRSRASWPPWRPALPCSPIWTPRRGPWTRR